MWEPSPGWVVFWYFLQLSGPTANPPIQLNRHETAPPNTNPTLSMSNSVSATTLEDNDDDGGAAVLVCSTTHTVWRFGVWFPGRKRFDCYHHQRIQFGTPSPFLMKITATSPKHFAKLLFWWRVSRSQWKMWTIRACRDMETTRRRTTKPRSRDTVCVECRLSVVGDVLEGLTRNVRCSTWFERK